MLVAIKGNPGTKIIFRVGSDDAKRLHETIQVTKPRELSNQSDHAFIAQYKSGNTQRGRSVLVDYPQTGHATRIQRMNEASFTRPVGRWLFRDPHLSHNRVDLGFQRAFSSGRIDDFCLGQPSKNR